MTKHQYTPLARITSIIGEPGFFLKPFERQLPKLFVVTDPARNPSPLKLAAHLPEDSALVYRHFGAANKQQTARELINICNQQGAVLLIGADPELADFVGADGVHLPERMIGDINQISRFNIVTCAAHSIQAAHKAVTAGAHGVVVSSVFTSTSPSARPALGLNRFRDFVRQIDGPVIALGGINISNVHNLRNSCHGIAMVSGAKS